MSVILYKHHSSIFVTPKYIIVINLYKFVSASDKKITAGKQLFKTAKTIDEEKMVQIVENHQQISFKPFSS